MKTFTFSRVPPRLTVETLAQYQRKELEQAILHMQKQIEDLENQITQLREEVNELKTN